MTLRSQMRVLRELKDKLQSRSNALELFRTTCFGPWLDINETYGDPLLIHTIIQCQVPSNAEMEELLYHVDGTLLRFSKQDFCLITGLLFGEENKRSHNSPMALIGRIFHNVEHWREVTVGDLYKLMGNNFCNLTDEDAVRVGLLLVLDLVFLGRQKDYTVQDWTLQLVEDINSWNRYPWGSLIWRVTFQQLYNAISKRTNENKEPKKYTLSGFIYAFKVRFRWLFGLLILFVEK